MSTVQKSDMNVSEFQFHPPKEAPVYRPTDEEFKDPLAYIAKIRPEAENYGICRIVPPQSFQPPFAVDVDNFRFTPRMQRLNELEATTRIKLNFLDQIAKFWELQGSSLKIPNVERKALDLFTLYRVVQEEGGMDHVSRERKWSRIATRMGYPAGRGIGTLLRQHYERILYPYDVFQTGASLGELKSINEDSDDSEKRDRDYIPHGIPSRQAIKPPPDRYARRSKRHGIETEEVVEGLIDYTTNSELKKLQFYGAGPKMPGYLVKEKGKYYPEDDIKISNYDSNGIESRICIDSKDGTESEAAKLGALLKRPNKPRGKRPIEQIVCTICNGGDDEASMLLCDGCDDSYHTFCLIPPLSEIPKGDWRCPRCVAEEVCKPQEAFGFEQAQREYTLQEFGEKADQFKSDYFSMPCHTVPLQQVEKEFWRIVNAVDEDVTVEYGADLHTIDHGSGFPNKKSKNLVPGEEDYINSGWNLNNLPVLEGSVLRHINADISGMKIPWTYVGMCFATFCWHNEDHWSYSINYLHWGEPKTWYGVPGGRAEGFEDAMRSVAPELFQTQPDLLHQLVTIMNPNLLINKGVPIFRTDQSAGQFVVTFPRSYHAGFNQGYNFAEAVNFAPADWLPIGRTCIAHYSALHRFCVFSHDELICFMANHIDSLEVTVARSTYDDMLKMIGIEKAQRLVVLKWGVRKSERKCFETLVDDERQCDYCKTTCFLSAVTCDCTYGVKIACIEHRNKLCSSCAPNAHTLLYRYTLDELPKMLANLMHRAESYDVWSKKAMKWLEAKNGDKMDLVEFKELIEEAKQLKFPKIEILDSLMNAVEQGEKYAIVAQQLLSRRVRTRHRQALDKNPARLTIEELKMFQNMVSVLPCTIKETGQVIELFENVMKFEREAKDALKDDSCESQTIEDLLETSLNLNIDLPEVSMLKERLIQTHWLEEVQKELYNYTQLSLEMVQKLIEKGESLPSHYLMEKTLMELRKLLEEGEKWDEKAKICLQARPRHSLALLESILKDALNIKAHLPNVILLKDAVKKAKDWTSKVHMLQNGIHNPYLDILEYLIHRGKTIPVQLEQYKVIENQVEAAKAWLEKVSRTFLKKNSAFTLLEVLSPRKDVGVPASGRGKKKKSKEGEECHRDDHSFNAKFTEAKDPATIVAAFKMAEKNEIEIMQELRAKNIEKRLEDVTDRHYCLCTKAATNGMIQCELCKDWFHSNCVPPPKAAGQKKQQQSSFTQSLFSQLSKEVKFLCPLCMRSRRPRLETILSLLVSLQKLPVRLPEGEALQCLTERGMSWQDRAANSLKTEELSNALSKLTFFSQKLVEQAAREKTEKIINTEIMKAASNPELKHHLQNVVPSAFGNFNLPSPGNNSNLGQKENSQDQNISSNSILQEVITNDNVAMDVELSTEVKSDSLTSANLNDDKGTENADISTNYNQEHAYSSVSKTTVPAPTAAPVNIPTASPRKHPRKSPLVARQMESPTLQLSDLAIIQLEQLMMEGDLLEINLEETQHIWNILQATKLSKDSFSSVSPFCDLENEELNVKCPKKKKRKLEETKGMKIKAPLKNKMKLVGKDDVKPKKKKIRLSKETSGSEENVKSKKLKLKSEKREKMKKDGTMKNKNKLNVGDKTGRKMRKPGTRTKNPKKNAECVVNEMDDICSASTCLHPIGAAVNWVQCDAGCDQWFHMLCVGIDAAEISEHEDYICPYCKSKNLLEMEDLENGTDLISDNGIKANGDNNNNSCMSSAGDSIIDAFTSENSDSGDSNINPAQSSPAKVNNNSSLRLSFDNCSFHSDNVSSAEPIDVKKSIKTEKISEC